MVGENNLSENLVTVHEIFDENGEKILVSWSAFAGPEAGKQVVKENSQRSGKHTYLGGY